MNKGLKLLVLLLLGLLLLFVLDGVGGLDEPEGYITQLEFSETFERNPCEDRGDNRPTHVVMTISISEVESQDTAFYTVFVGDTIIATPGFERGGLVAGEEDVNTTTSFIVPCHMTYNITDGVSGVTDNFLVAEEPL